MNTKKTNNRNGSSENLTSNDDDYLKQIIFEEYLKAVEVENSEFKLKNPDLSNIEFHLLQAIPDKALIKNIFFNLAYFYDTNYTGNKDFIHIPNMGTIVNNSFKYPILFVTQGKNSYRVNHILGATMIKIENNHSMNDNPYFPTVNEDVLTISCILTKYNAMYKNHKIKGIGSKLFRICIKSANEINKNKKIRLICEVDCRNINCFHSIKKAIQELQSQNINVKVCITGYYEIKDNQQHLLEAPTFILEMILEGNETKMAHDDIELNYSNCYSEDLFEELKGIIQHNTQEIKEYKNNDAGNRTIVYHEIEKINLEKVTFNIGDTAKGNNRISNLMCLQYKTASKELLKNLIEERKNNEPRKV